MSPFASLYNRAASAFAVWPLFCLTQITFQKVIKMNPTKRQFQKVQKVFFPFLIALLTLLFSVGSTQSAQAQTFTFECICDTIQGANCDICNTQTLRRTFNGLLIRRNGVAWAWVDEPYTIRQLSGGILQFAEQGVNPQTVQVSRAQTPFATMQGFIDSTTCFCTSGGAGGPFFVSDSLENSAINEGDTLQIVGRGIVNVTLDSAAQKFIISADQDSVTLSGLRGIVISGAFPSYAVALPTATTHQTMRYDGTNWVSSSEILNNENEVGIGGSPVSGFELYVNGATRSDGALVSRGTGSFTGSLASPHVRLWNTTPTTGDTWYLGSTDGGAFQVQSSNLGGTMLQIVPTSGQVQTTNTLRIGAVTGTPTQIIGRNGSGDVGGVTIGSGLSLSGGSLSATGGGITGSGTAGQVTYWNGASSITGENGLTYNAATNTMTVGASGQGRVIIDQGTSWSQAITAGSLEFGSYTTDNCWFGSNVYWAPGFTYRNTGPAALFYFINGGFEFRTAGSGTGGTSAPITAKFYMTNNGDVGIGAAPARKLHVEGAARITGSAGTPTAIMGRAANGDIANLTLGSGLSITSGTLSATATGTIGGSIAATQVGYGSASNTLAGESDFTYDATNNRLTVGTSGGTGTFNARYGAVSSAEPFRAEGNVSGNMVSTYSNTFNASGAGNVITQYITGGASGGDPISQFGVSGVVSHAFGLDNSDGDKIKITPNASLPGENANASFVVTNNTPPRYGVNVDAPAYEFEGTDRWRTGFYMSRSATLTLTFGTGAGTGPSGASALGTANGGVVGFTTGTSPAANADIFTVTIPYSSPNTINPVICAANPQAATDISKFYIISTTNNSFTVRANGTISASTNYSLRFVISG